MEIEDKHCTEKEYKNCSTLTLSFYYHLLYFFSQVGSSPFNRQWYQHFKQYIQSIRLCYHFLYDLFNILSYNEYSIGLYYYFELIKNADHSCQCEYKYLYIHSILNLLIHQYLDNYVYNYSNQYVSVCNIATVYRSALYSFLFFMTLFFDLSTFVSSPFMFRYCLYLYTIDGQ